MKTYTLISCTQCTSHITLHSVTTWLGKLVLQYSKQKQLNQAHAVHTSCYMPDQFSQQEQGKYKHCAILTYPWNFCLVQQVRKAALQQSWHEWYGRYQERMMMSLIKSAIKITLSCTLACTALAIPVFQ